VPTARRYDEEKTMCRALKPLTVLNVLIFSTLLQHYSQAVAGTTGILEGRITSKESREPLVGASVVVVGTKLGAPTDESGIYQIPNVRPGIYDVRFSMAGYKTIVMKDVTIVPDLRTRLDIELEPSAVELEVEEVRAERPLIQKDLSATAFSVGGIKIEKLPVSTFKDVLSLQPSTTLEGNVRGGKTTEVLFLIDGLAVQDVIGGGLGTNLPRSSITGLTLHTGGFDAEYGNAMSGVVNVITKTGGNSHEFAVRYERDKWLPDRWDQQTDHTSEVEVSAGGPIIRDQLYYFTANTFNWSDTRWWQDFQRFQLSPISQEFSGFGKIEYVPSRTLRLSTQGIYSLRRWRDYEFSWRFNLNGLPPLSRSSFRVATTLSNTLSETAFYSLSLSTFYLRSRIGEGDKNSLTLQPYQYDFFLQYILSGERNWWADSRQVIYTLKGDFTQQFSKMHLLKVGFELSQYDIFSELVKYEPQTTYFGKPLVEAPLLNYSNSYKYYPRSGSVFIQDKVEIVRDGSNFSVGARWDFLDPTAERPIVEFIPVTAAEYQQQVTGKVKATVKHNFSLRGSFAAPAGPSSFFFVNVGQYIQYPLFDYLYSGINPAELRGGVKNVLAGNPDLEPERTIAWEIGFKHGINENVVASATYFKKDIKNQIDTKTLVPFDSKYSGDFGFASYVNNAEASVYGVELVLSREHDKKLSGSASYSYMVTEGFSDYVNQGVNLAMWGFPLAVEPYPLSWDQRHTVKIDAEFKLWGDIESDLIVLYNSARPFTFYPTRDGFTPLDSTKAFLPNNRRMDDVLFFNVKLTKRFELGGPRPYVVTIYADIRNALNKRNVVWMDSNGRIGGELGDPSAYYDPRRVRVGARLQF
jgi:outer membrane receptor protein involved in Fe transport